jgi:hypothetical protein
MDGRRAHLPLPPAWRLGLRPTAHGAAARRLVDAAVELRPVATAGRCELKMAPLTKPDLSALGAGLRSEIAGLKADLFLLKWMAGFNLATSVAVLFLLLRR